MERKQICLWGWNLMAVIARRIITICGSLRPNIDDIDSKIYIEWENEAEHIIPYNCEYDRWEEDDFESIKKYVAEQDNPYCLYALLCRLCNHWQVEHVRDCMREEFSSLNDNVGDTQIIVTPKLKCSWEKEDTRRNFTQYSIIDEEKLKEYKVIHHILSPIILSEKKRMRIAFSPIGKVDSLKIEAFNKKDEYGVEHNYIKPTVKVERKKEIEKLTARALQCSAKYGADVFLAPELLGADACVKSSRIGDEEYSDWIRNQYFNLIENDFEPPSICILPELRDTHNSMAVFNNEARLIARQEKHHPYVDKTGNVKEWLPPHEKVIHLFHIRNGGRFCIMICADFLNDTYRRTIAEELDVSLILIPSYSKGITDFINAAPSELFNGTYVLWGNTCDVTYLYQGKEAEFLSPVGCLAVSRKREVEIHTMIPPGIDDCRNRCQKCQKDNGVCMYFVDIPLTDDHEARCYHISKIDLEA